MTTTFAEDGVTYSDGQVNVNEPSGAVMSSGFTPQTADARGMPLPAQWLNWLFRKTFRLLNRDVVSDATGASLFTVADSFIRLEAFDRADPNKYLVAIGYKGETDVVHSLKVVSSSTLALGTGTASGDQPVTGGSNVITLGMSRQFGDI